MDPIYQHLLDSLNRQTPRIEKCLAKLTTEQIWTRPLPKTNSIGNICLHLAGNENHYIGACLGQNGYERDRPSEFDANEGPDAAGLIAGLHEAREKTTAILEPLGAEDCHRPVVANYPPDA